MNVKILLILCLCFLLILSGCNSKSDVKHLTQDEMTKYVQDRIGEKVVLVSAIGDESGDKAMEYVFKIVERDIEFEVTAQKWANSIDGMIVGNFKLSIGIGYEKGVKKHYQSESLKLAKDYDVEYKLKDSGGGVTTVGSYSDIDNLTDFIIELDKLYAFEIKDASRSNPSVGIVIFTDVGSDIAELRFSRDSGSRLNGETLKSEIIKWYVLGLKMRDLTDSEVPQDVWDKYQSGGEYEGP